MKALKSITKIIINILTSIIFAILVLLIFVKVNTIVSGKDHFEIFGYSFFNVITGSMEPTISVNDIVIVKNTNEIKNDDIITYRKDKEYVTHRVVNVNNGTLTTKGDANNADDDAITLDKVVGKVIKIIPRGGVWQQVFTNPSIVISIFVTLIMFDFAFSFKGFKNKKLAEKVDKIDLNVVQKNSPFENLSEEDIVKIYEKIDKIKKKEDVTFKKEEKEFLDYTVRLDLEEIQKGINKNMNEEK